MTKAYRPFVMVSSTHQFDRIICFKGISTFKIQLYSFNAADRAKQIKTKAIVNEDPTEALIRELKEQNEKLKMQLQTGKVDTKDLIAMSDNDNVSPEGKMI